MKKFLLFFLTVLIATISSVSLKAQVKPIVMDINLYNQYTGYISDTTAFRERLDKLNDRIESIKRTFPKQENDSDIKLMVDPIKSEISDIENRRKIAFQNIKTDEDSLKKIIIDAHGIPVVWRSANSIPPGMYPNKITEQIFSIKNGNIVVTDSRIDLK
jgi:ABC-type uncharacterized transport system fused permease/ATPase subunit